MTITSGDQPIMAEIDPKLEQEIKEMGMRKGEIMQVFVNVTGKNKLQSVGLVYPTMKSITIKLADGQEFNIKDGSNGLRISAYNGRLAIEPEASNVVQVSELKE